VETGRRSLRDSVAFTPDCSKREELSQARLIRVQVGSCSGVHAQRAIHGVQVRIVDLQWQSVAVVLQHHYGERSPVMTEVDVCLQPDDVRHEVHCPHPGCLASQCRIHVRQRQPRQDSGKEEVDPWHWMCLFDAKARPVSPAMRNEDSDH
jgi:hypothetical protein